MTVPAGLHAIVLAAGAGSRLAAEEPVKPLTLVGGRALVHHVLDVLARAGVRSATVVTGHAAAELGAALGDAALPVETCFNPHWADAPNGVSLLAAADRVSPGTLLCMADHLLSPHLVSRLLEAPAAPLSLAVDRRLGHPWVDEADVTRVRTEAGAILAIGKRLAVYDCYDTGLFRIGPELCEALAGAAAPSLSHGVALLARRGLARAVDVGDAPWLDVDDARALRIARGSWGAA